MNTGLGVSTTVGQYWRIAFEIKNPLVPVANSHLSIPVLIYSHFLEPDIKTNFDVYQDAFYIHNPSK